MKTICTNPTAHKSNPRRVLLLATTALVASVALPALAQQQQPTHQECIEAAPMLLPGCEHINAGTVVNMPLGENEELEVNAGLLNDGFLISVDGDVIAGDGRIFDDKRPVDLALNAASIQVKLDELEVLPILNVVTSDVRTAYRAGEVVRFRSSMNYPGWIDRAEVRVFNSAGDLVATLPTNPNGTADWHMPNDGDGELQYTLRVYDSRGRFDETEPLMLTRTSRAYTRASTNGAVIAAGEGQDRTALRNIQINGAAVTVFGENLPAGAQVTVMGQPVSVDAGNKFVVQRIMAPGDHDISVDVHRNGILLTGFERELHVPNDDWFYVALADVTVGLTNRNYVSDASGELNRINVDGRAAFYLKGKIKGEYILTAAADTGNGPLIDLFRNLDAKDARSLLRRIDPNAYYPVYGDDSSIEDGAPTSGKFYIRIERGDSHVMWGNFKTAIVGSEYLHNERTLYGAEAVYRSEESTPFGERRTEAVAYAAQPDTAPQRDSFLGTGGSAYFLKRQDLSIGSETVTIVTRDPDTGRVISTQTLQNGDDYRIDYIQGVIILTHPLSATSGTNGVVGDGVLGDNSVHLVVQYEYSPTLDDLDGFAYGGRVQHWVNDRIRVGATAMQENTGVADQTSLGADIHVKLGENSYFEAEYAQTRGPGFGSSSSSDGGLTITDSGTAGLATVGRAYNLKVHGDLGELIDPSVDGTIGAYYERMEAGFSTLDREISVNQQSWGVYGTYAPSENLTIGATYDDFNDDAGKVVRVGEIEAGYQVNEQLLAEVGVQFTDKITPGTPSETGDRVDAAIRLTYAFDEDRSIYGFGQGTLASNGGLEDNTRYGLGGSYRLNEKVVLSGEVSDGTKGLGGQAMLEYQPNADDLYYLGYRLDPGRTVDGFALNGTDNGGIVLGAKRTYSEYLSGFVENNYDLFGVRRSLTSTYGVTYTPDATRSFTGGLEVGRVRDDVNGDFDRTAASFGASYNDDGQIAAHFRVEGRWENGVGLAQDRTTYLIASGVQYKTSEDWRLLGAVDAVFSESDQDSLLNGRYLEASFGYAYRPVDNDRLNMLFKYTYLYDMPGADQVSADGTTDGPKQRSHILSVDGIYDIGENWSIGGKYGYRMASVAPRASNVFTSNTAHLGVLRADFHIVHEWDGMIEGRGLFTEESAIMETGATVALYRHFGNNLKAGVGYHFGNVSSDLRAIDNVDNGLFLNLIAKY